MIKFTVPYYRRLTSHTGWDRNSKRDYSVVRFHFASVPQPSKHGLQVGPPVAEVTVPEGVTESVEIERKVSVSVTNQVKAVREWITESESFSEFATTIGGAAKVVGFKLEPKFTNTMRQRFSEKLRIEDGRTTTASVTRDQTVRVKIEVDGDIVAGDRTYIASSYRERIETLYLAYFDVLAVKYVKPRLVATRRRIKLPEFMPDWNRLAVSERPNVSRPLKLPICSVRYWEFVPDSHPVFKAKDYPHQIDLGSVEALPAIVAGPQHGLAFSMPSLYKLANGPFPLKWSKFKALAKSQLDDDVDDSEDEDDWDDGAEAE